MELYLHNYCGAVTACLNVNFNYMYNEQTNVQLIDGLLH
jgi:hypothetical protein